MVFGEPKPDTLPGVHETVLEMLKTEKKVGRVLDAGAGEGPLTEKLIEMGFEVQACDLNPARFMLKNVVCKKVDLNKKLPYDDEFFDIVFLVEVIEHLSDPWHIISELRRVLKKNGKIIVTTPNILALQSRVHFLLLGEHLLFEYGRLWKKPKNVIEKLDLHITPLSFPQLIHILTKNSLKLEAVAINRRYPFLSHRPLYYLISCFLHNLTSSFLHKFIKRIMKKRFGKFKISALTLDRLLDDLLSGETLIIKGRKLSCARQAL